MTVNIAAVLAANPFFRSLPEAPRAKVVSSARLHTFRAGQFLWSKGDDVDSYCLVVDGLLESSLPLSNGRHPVLEILRAGDMCGCVIQLLGGQAFCSLRALTHATVLCLPAHSTRRAFALVGGWHEALAQGLARRLRRLFSLRAISFMPSRNRIPALLLWLDTATGKDIPLTQNVLSMMAGVSEGTVCRALAPLKKRDLIRISRGRIAIVNRESLRRTCEGLWSAV